VAAVAVVLVLERHVDLGARGARPREVRVDVADEHHHALRARALRRARTDAALVQGAWADLVHALAELHLHLHHGAIPIGEACARCASLTATRVTRPYVLPRESRAARVKQ